jgi:hypothetical protein
LVINFHPELFECLLCKEFFSKLFNGCHLLIRSLSCCSHD